MYMKKDKKFLKDLAENLKGISDEEKDAIVLKYKKIIAEGKRNKRKIFDIINDLGDPVVVAKTELSLIRKPSFFSRIINKIKEMERKDKEQKQKDNERLKEKFNSIKNKLFKKEKTEKKNNVNKESKNKSIKSYFESFKSLFKKKTKKEKIIDKIEEEVAKLEEDFEEEISNVSEIVTETHLFESKEQKRRSIILRFLGIIFLTIMLFIWLWVSVVFIASLFALLDGIKIIGINIALFGLDVLVLWLIVISNRAIFKRKNNFKLNVIVVISSVFLIAVGIASAAYKIYKIDRVDDVSVKYSMTNKSEIFNLPSDNNKKLYLIFNGNYDIQYIVNYDDNYSNKVKVDTSYYECYYNYFTKKSSNNVYISLNTNFRDRLSTYISDLKDGYIVDNDELSRYLVKITISKNDMGRLVIED